MLVLDSGNALFATASVPDEAAKQRARLVLEAMGESGTVAMAAGARDLAAGADFLAEAASRARVPVLSANLVARDGSRVFPASLVVLVGGVRVGLIGASPSGPRAGPVLPAVIAEAARLTGQVDLLVVLAALPMADAEALSTGLGRSVDLVFQSHDGRGLGVVGRNGNLMLTSGDRGRGYGRMELTLAGTGPLVDATPLAEHRAQVAALERQTAEARGAARRELEARRDALLHAAPPEPAGGRRIESLRLIQLGPDVADDASLRSRVDRLAAPDAGRAR